MAPVSEGKRIAEFLVSEANGCRSRHEGTVTVPANTTIPAGRVMGQLASGKFVPHDADGAAGEDTETGILYANLTNDTGGAVDVTATVIVRDAEVNKAHLTYDPAANDAAKTASDGVLAGLGIIVR